MEENNENQDNQTIENNNDNNKDSFFVKRKQEIAAVVGLIILTLLTHISLFTVLLIGLYLIATAIMSKKATNLKTLAKLMNIILIISFAYLGVSEIMSRSAEKKFNIGEKIDQTFSQLMPGDNEIRAADIFEDEKKKAVEDFRPYYRQLLNEGRVEEAAEIFTKFEEKWNFKVQIQKAERTRKSETKKVDQKGVSQNIKKYSRPSPPVIKDSIFYPGTYEIEVNKITDFYIVPESDNKYQYFTLDSEDREYQLIFSNKNLYNANSQIYEKELRFKLKATGNDKKEKITMTVS
ncbi:MAG: hypothetical protein PF488_03950 [Patescibacteria group bacterium]|jgi:ABC-type multidrug transport system fused ATPase/permease subunit|nr:hypothetical protein [Patescibacteria group bacterium]